MSLSLVFEIKNFLSLRNVSIKFDNLNVLIGPNASGKSNVIKALEFVSEFVREGSDAINHLLRERDFTNITFLGQGGDVEFELEFNDFRYSLQMKLGSLTEEVYHKKKLIFKRISMPEWEQISYLNANNTMRTSSFSSRQTIVGRISIPLLQISKLDVCFALRDITKFLSSVTIYSFDPESIRSKSNIKATPKLGRRGNNLARVILHYYLENRTLFSELENVFKMLIPDVKEIVPVLRDDYVWVALREKYSDMLIDPEFLSDGSLRILALLVSLFGKNSIVAYEEPENFVHPRLLESIVDIIKKFDKIVIITTHSPYLLDYVEPKDIILVTKVQGETKPRRLIDTDDIVAVKKYLEEGGTLGEAWFSGLMGDI